jgi:hypothetical protein
MAGLTRRSVPPPAGVLACAVLTLAAACGAPGGDIVVSLDPRSDAAVLVVDGLSSDELRALGIRDLPADTWQRVLRVSVAGGSADQPAVVGRYVIAGDRLEFHPLFGFDAGRAYDVRFDRAAIPNASRGGVTTSTVARPKADRTPSTRVARVRPTSRVWPENHLRFYIEFSAPMSRTSGLDYVRLVDADGREVVDPFLPLDVEFWNADHTRYTMFFDPGRVKRDILPNREMGRALEPGARYAVVVSHEWRDAAGLPLVESFRHEFTVGPADESPVAPRDWQVRAPAAGTRDALVVSFPEPLDHGLLLRAVGVRRDGDALAGDVTIGEGETEWHYTPASPWRAGAYDLVVLSLLEDLAGNRVGQPFEVDRFDAVDDTPAPEETLIRFTVGG